MTQLKTAPEAMSLTGEIVEFRLGFNHDKEGLLVWKDRDESGGVKALPTNHLLTGYIRAVTVTQADIRKMVHVKMRDGWDRDMLITFVAEATGEGVNLTGLRLLAEMSSAHKGVKIQLANMQSPSRHGLGVVAGAYQMGFALHANYGTGRPNVVPPMHLRSEALSTVLARLQSLYPETEAARSEDLRETARAERQR